MKEVNIIFGDAGFAKEIDWLLNDLYIKFPEKDFRAHYFVVYDEQAKVSSLINDKKVISEIELHKLLESNSYLINAFIGVGSPALKKIIYEKFSKFKNITFPSIIHPSVAHDKRINKVKIGKGVIICANCSLTTDIEIRDFVHINLNCTVGHDTIIDEFSTLSPGAVISGNVTIEKSVFIGSNATILERIKIVNNSIVGAGCIVLKNIFVSGTYVGNPAKRVK